jgi:phosphate transport system permease protein
MRAVPGSQREAALSLGATRWETTRTAVIPYARSGIMGAIFLALARALGETMAVTMVIGNVPQIKASLLAPAYTVAAVIANEFTEAADQLYLAALIYAGLVLFIVTLAVNILARILVARVARGPSLIRE